MEGVGEKFGRAVDMVLRRPRVVLVPLLIDVVFLGLGTMLFWSLANERILFPQGYRLPDLPVAVPHALPTVGDVVGPEPDLHVFDLPVVAAAVSLVLLAIPLLAFAEAGFLGVLRAVYLEKADVLREGRHPDAWSRIREAFLGAARAHGAAFLVLRGIQAALALTVLGLPFVLPRFGSYGLGILAVDVLLIYAPYAVLERRRGAMAAIRESVQLVSDHLATTLVALLFGFLLTGGVAILLQPLPLLLGPWALLLASAIYAPVGTALSLFLYIVYREFHPEEALPGAAPAADHVPVAG